VNHVDTILENIERSVFVWFPEGVKEMARYDKIFSLLIKVFMCMKVDESDGVSSFQHLL
jgi:hypothetical protein